MTSFFELSDSPRRVDDDILSTLESVCNLSRSNVGDITFRGVDGRRRLIQVRKKPFTFSIGGLTWYQYRNVLWRVGDTCILDDRLKGEIYSCLPTTDVEANFLWLHHGESIIQKPLQMPHTALTVHAVESIAPFLPQAVVLEFGSADGIPGLVAKRCGAASIVSLEKEAKWQNPYFDHIITNGFHPADFTFICADILSDGEYLQHNLPIKTKVVIANIGPTYGDVDQKVVEFLSNLPHTQIFIGAGHVKNRQASDYNDQLLESLSQVGFSQNYREIVDSDSRLAFIIERY